MNIKVIDNYLPKKNLQNIIDIVSDNYFPWYFIKGIVDDDHIIKNQFYYTHMLFRDSKLNSSAFEQVISNFLKKKFWKNLIRVKVNSYPHNEFVEHPFHRDFDYDHKAALFSINSCDGYTKFEDGTKVKSVKNRMLFFDPSIKHCSTNTSNCDRRININFNYF